MTAAKAKFLDTFSTISVHDNALGTAECGLWRTIKGSLSLSFLMLNMTTGDIKKVTTEPGMVFSILGLGIRYDTENIF